LPAALGVATAGDVGTYLVDEVGHALYVLEADLGASTCFDACLKAWPALVIPADTTSAPAPPVQAGNLGSHERRDGLVQATYFRQPLYRYVKDAEPGDHHGHDVRDAFGHWSLVRPDGQAVAWEGDAGP
jgi:predicted lipoprotein with Yx(FWY)xxD motif